jgi:hypothetical protein
MPSNQARVNALLTAGLRSEMINAYDPKYKGVSERIGSVMRLAIPSDKRQEIFGYWETAPYPGIWKRGDTLAIESFDSVQWTVVNHDWAVAINWHEDDEQDDQTQGLLQRARDAGTNFATLDERVFYQILNGAADANLLPSIPNAPDGVDLFNATDGAGAARFGVSGGNIESGATLTTAAGIRAALFDAIERFGRFQDTKGQPLLNLDDVIAGGFCLFYPVAQEQLVREAVIQGRTLAIHPGTSTTDTTAAAAVTNILLESGLRFDLVPSQRMTGTTMAIFAKAVEHKAVFSLARQPLREQVWGRENSDEGRFKKERGIMWDARRGYGVGLPYAAIQITA